jgi:uncharacterized protein (DUF433 family)
MPQSGSHIASERSEALRTVNTIVIPGIFVKTATTMVDYKQIITLEPGKRGGKPCIRGMRITVSDILGWLASGMTVQEILADFEELTEKDIYAALSYAADRENKIYQVAV